MANSKRPRQTPFRDCIGARVRLLNRAVTGIYDDALRPHGLKTSQMNILVVIGELQPVRPADVCRALRLDTSTLSRNVDRMRSRGWVEVVPEPDQRAHCLQLSRAGRRLLTSSQTDWERAQDEAEALLGRDGVDAVLQAVGRVKAQD